MLIQKELEAKIISELSAALTSGNLADVCRITGSWQPVATGLVKWLEDDADKPAIISVSLGAPGRSTFSDPTTALSGKVSLFLRHENDPTGSLLVNIAEVVQSCLDGWQAESYQAYFTRFDTTTFSVDDLAVDRGDSPSFQGDKVAVAWPFTISGSFK